MSLAATAAWAQTGVIRIVVPFAAGGVQDIVARSLSPEALNALLRADFAKMARVVKASGARID